ncbi:MAG TPA: hypothetical protein VE621_16460 [Bryobacteraceae bacterium]|nr:hypothetical protein [Bryobacteraceae bacterium]
MSKLNVHASDPPWSTELPMVIERADEVEISTASLVAMLLTASASLAEEAVMQAIEWMDRSEELLRMTVVASIKITPSEQKHGFIGDGLPVLPDELQDLVQLPLRLRQAFVLRLLLAMPRDFSAGLLDLDLSTLDQMTTLAARILAQRSLRRTAVN